MKTLNSHVLREISGGTVYMNNSKAYNYLKKAGMFTILNGNYKYKLYCTGCKTGRGSNSMSSMLGFKLVHVWH